MSNACSRRNYNRLVHADPRWTLFADAWPGWQISFAHMTEDEGIDWDNRIIWLNCHVADPLFRAAHAAAHLKLHYGVRGSFTDRQEDDASWHALMWLSWTGESRRSPSSTGGE